MDVASKLTLNHVLVLTCNKMNQQIQLISHLIVEVLFVDAILSSLSLSLL